MAIWSKLKFWSSRFWNNTRRVRPVHLERGSLGEDAARDYLKEQGLKFLTANFKCKEGEIDLVFRDGESLVFVEVKTRTAGGWTRPSKAVDNRKRKALVQTASEYLRLLGTRDVAYRFDVVEVLLKEGAVAEVRHNVNSFHSKMVRPRGWRR
jgi:putative endonuclease